MFFILSRPSAGRDLRLRLQPKPIVASKFYSLPTIWSQPEDSSGLKVLQIAHNFVMIRDICCLKILQFTYNLVTTYFLVTIFLLKSLWTFIPAILQVYRILHLHKPSLLCMAPNINEQAQSSAIKSLMDTSPNGCVKNFEWWVHKKQRKTIMYNVLGCTYCQSESYSRQFWPFETRCQQNLHNYINIHFCPSLRRCPTYPIPAYLPTFCSSITKCH